MDSTKGTAFEILKSFGTSKVIESNLFSGEEKALAIIVKWGGIDGSHHKSWVLDQVVRVLIGKEYEALVAWAKDGEYGPESYSWDEGIAP